MNQSPANCSLPTVDILLVEDTRADADLALRALQKASYSDRIRVVRDGAEALDFIFGTAEQPPATPQLVLLDLKLPKVDGLEVLRRLKGDCRTRAIPVVVLSSSQEQRDLTESYQLGANSYIIKPVNFDRFTATILQVVTYWRILNQPCLVRA